MFTAIQEFNVDATGDDEAPLPWESTAGMRLETNNAIEITMKRENPAIS